MDGAMIVSCRPECCKVAGTAWNGADRPEKFISRARLYVVPTCAWEQYLVGRHGDLPFLRSGHRTRGGPQRGGCRRLPLGLAVARRPAGPRSGLFRQARRRPFRGHAAGERTGGMERPRKALERCRGVREKEGR